MVVSSQIRRRHRKGEQGYILLTLLLIIALMAVFAAVLVTDIKFSIKRDREEEMIHRGVQYSRAIRAYYRKFNRYPAKIEDLENTNQMRFLRKRYKDPLNCKEGKCADFRLLHYGEAKLALGGMGGGMVPGASTVGANGQLVQQGGFQTSSFGGTSSFGTSSSYGQNSGFGNSNSAFGQSNQNTQNTQPSSDSSQQPAANGQESQDAGNGSTTNPEIGGGTAGSGGSAFSGQFGGAPIVGVASLSKDKTIREFDKKKKYNEWQFVYDPTMDRGGLITTPYQPQLMQALQGMQNMNGQNGTSPNGNSGFGNSFGNSGGLGNSFGNSPGGMQNTPTAPPSQPSNPPQQQ